MQVKEHGNRFRENVRGRQQCSYNLLSALANSAFLTTREGRQKPKVVRTLSSLPGKSLLVHWFIARCSQDEGGCGQTGSDHSMTRCWSWPLHIPLQAAPPQVFKHVFTLFICLLDSIVSHLMEAPFTYINHFIGLFSDYYCVFRIFKNTYAKYFHLVHGTHLIFLQHFMSKYTIRCCMGTQNGLMPLKYLNINFC